MTIYFLFRNAAHLKRNNKIRKKSNHSLISKKLCIFALIMVIKRLFIVAHPYEIGLERLVKEGFSLLKKPFEHTQLYVNGQTAVALIGIGAEEALRSMQALHEEGWLSHPIDILLSGSAGSYTIPVLNVVQCSTSFPNVPMELPIANIECVHEFVSPSSPHPELHQPDTAFDMESETIIYFLQQQSPEAIGTFSIVKVISDDGSGSLGDWASVCCQHVQPRVIEVLRSIVAHTSTPKANIQSL